MLRCPVCRSPLARHNNSYRCDGGHSFDIARSGYVNLLQSGSTRVRGDDSKMLRSRHAFLEAGFYEPLLNEVTAHAAAAVGHSAATAHLLDVGCGEGYYTRALPAASETWGMDVSRTAVDMAARRHGEASFAVASARDLPIQDHAVDVLVCIFGPHEPTEYWRVLKASGRAIIVRPGADHLIELRRHLYWNVRAPGRGDVRSFGGEWRVVHRAQLRYPMRLGPQSRSHLLAMTPYAWAGGEESRQAILGSVAEAVTAQFLIFVLGPA